MINNEGHEECIYSQILLACCVVREKMNYEINQEEESKFFIGFGLGDSKEWLEEVHSSGLDIVMNWGQSGNRDLSLLFSGRRKEAEL